MIPILFAFVLGFGVGLGLQALFRDRRERLLREAWAARERALLANQQEERGLMRTVEGMNRKSEAEERGVLLATIDRLCTRVQAWEPAAPQLLLPSGTASPPASASQVAEEQTETPYGIDELLRQDIRMTQDGLAYVDLRSGKSWERPEDIAEWREFCRKNAIPSDADPGPHLAKGRLTL